jgi:MFS family permease
MQSAVTTARAPSLTTFLDLQHVALPAVFALSGLLLGSWASRIPALQAGLHISHSSLSFVLLCGGLGGLFSYPLATRAMLRLGGRKTMLTGALALSAVLPAIGLAPDMPLLMLAVLMLGVSAGIYGVGVNSVAIRYEKASGKSQMSMLHAWGCGGSLGGALLGSMMAGRAVAPKLHFMLVAMPVALLFWISYLFLEADEAGERLEKKRFALPSGPLLALGVLVLCMAISENSIADWSAVFLKKHFGVSEGFAPLALSCFTSMMLLSRLFGDKLKEKHGAARLIMSGASLSAFGLFVAVFAPNPYVALFGFACSGLGLALVTPFVFSAAGRQGPLAAGAVATMGNIGGLMGPPVIGTTADALGMQAAIGFIGLLSLVITFVASRSSLLR